LGIWQLNYEYNETIHRYNNDSGFDNFKFITTVIPKLLIIFVTTQYIRKPYSLDLKLYRMFERAYNF